METEQQYPGENGGQSSKYLVPGAIVVAGALIALAIYGGGGKPSTATPNEQGQDDIKVEAVTAEDHILGSRNAEIVIVEYSDTECPYCKMFHGTMKQVLSDYGNKVAWVYRHLPIEQLHSKAIKQSEATECAAELGGNQIFWQYIDKIFEATNSNDSLDMSLLPKFAAELGLDGTKFNECLNSGKYTAFVKESIAQGFAAGARGTPYSLILNREGKVLGIINGAEPLSGIKAKIDALQD